MSESQQESDGNFGARFLEVLDRESGTRGHFNYAQRQAFRAAEDAEAFLAALKEESPLLPYAAIQKIRRESPEKLAEQYLRQFEARQMQGLMLMILIT